MASDACAAPKLTRQSETAERLKVLFVTRKWAPATGGMETYCQKLTEALAVHASVEVIALHGRSNAMPPKLLALLSFPLRVLKRYLDRDGSPHVLHLGDMAIWPLALPAVLWRGTILVLSAHGTDVSYHRRNGLRGRLYGAYLRLGAKLLGGARVIANSRATREMVQETNWRDIVVIPLATDFFGPEPDGTHNGCILFVGRLIELKGCRWFVREVMPLLPDFVRLIVAGTIWDQKEAEVLENPGVDFIGALDPSDLAVAYASAMCVVVPNVELASGQQEGFGLVAPEAASAGGVVLAADHGGLRDAVIDGETGFLLPSGNPRAWANTVSKIVAWSIEERKSYLRRSQAQALRHYSWNRVARETLEAYRAAHGRHPPGEATLTVVQ